VYGVTHGPQVAVVGEDGRAAERTAERAAKVVGIEVGAERLRTQDAGVAPKNGSNLGRIRIGYDQGQPPPLFPPELAGSPEVCDVHGRYLDAAERKRGACSWCADGVPAPAIVMPGQPPRDVWRCPAPGCGSMERRVRPGGSWRCASRGHESRDYLPPPAVAAGTRRRPSPVTPAGAGRRPSITLELELANNGDVIDSTCYVERRGVHRRKEPAS
jgi:hypothetical protein